MRLEIYEAGLEFGRTTSWTTAELKVREPEAGPEPRQSERSRASGKERGYILLTADGYATDHHPPPISHRS